MAASGPEVHVAGDPTGMVRATQVAREQCPSQHGSRSSGSNGR